MFFHLLCWGNYLFLFFPSVTNMKLFIYLSIFYVGPLAINFPFMIPFMVSQRFQEVVISFLFNSRIFKIASLIQLSFSCVVISSQESEYFLWFHQSRFFCLLVSIEKTGFIVLNFSVVHLSMFFLLILHVMFWLLYYVGRFLSGLIYLMFHMSLGPW